MPHRPGWKKGFDPEFQKPMRPYPDADDPFIRRLLAVGSQMVGEFLVSVKPLDEPERPEFYAAMGQVYFNIGVIDRMQLWLEYKFQGVEPADYQAEMGKLALRSLHSYYISLRSDSDETDTITPLPAGYDEQAAHMADALATLPFLNAEIGVKHELLSGLTEMGTEQGKYTVRPARDQINDLIVAQQAADPSYTLKPIPHWL